VISDGVNVKNDDGPYDKPMRPKNMQQITHPLRLLITLLGLSSCTIALAAEEPDIRKLTPRQSAAAAANYEKYCVLCDGADRQGYVNDHAPSLMHHTTQGL
jgi:hypothetical protein